MGILLDTLSKNQSSGGGTLFQTLSSKTAQPNQPTANYNNLLSGLPKGTPPTQKSGLFENVKTARAQVGPGIAKVGTLFKELAQGTARTAIATGLDILRPTGLFKNNEYNPANEPSPGLANLITGGQTVVPLSTRAGQVKTNIQNVGQKLQNTPGDTFLSSLARGTGTVLKNPIVAGTLGVGSQVGRAVIDLTPFGGEVGATERLAKESTVEGTVKLLEKMAGSEDPAVKSIIQDFAPRFAATTDKAEIKAGLSEFDKALQDLKPTIQSEVSKSFEALGTGHAKFSSGLDSLVKEGTMLPEDANLLKDAFKGTNDKLLEKLDIGSLDFRNIPGLKDVVGLGGTKGFGGNPGIRIQTKLAQEFPDSFKLLGGDFHSSVQQASATFLHEYGHIAHDVVLSQEDRNIVQKAFDKMTPTEKKAFFGVAQPTTEVGHAASYYSGDVKEFLAQSFAEYVLANKVPDSSMKPLLEKLWETFRTYIQKIKDRISPSEIQRLQPIFDRMLSGEGFNPAKTQVESLGYSRTLKPNINLDKFDLSSEAKSRVEDILRANSNFEGQRRYIQGHGDTEALASGLIPNINLRKGQILNAEETVALLNTANTIAERYDRLAEKVASGNATEQEILQFRKADSDMALVMASVAGNKAEQGRALEINKRIAESLNGDIKLIREGIKASGGMETAQTIAYQLRRIPKEDKLGKIKFIRDINKATTKDKVYEVWLNSILSNPTTQMANFLGNTINALMLVPRRGIQAAISSFVPGERVYMKEVNELVAGALSGFTDGVQKGLYAFRNGVSMEQVSKLDTGFLPAIGGKTGEVIRTPTKILTGVDEFFKAVIGTAELRAQAYRTAANSGLKGEKLLNRMAELIANPTKELIDSVEAAKLEATFQEKSKFANAMIRLRDSNPLIKYIVPFVKTPTNIARQALKTTPLGFLNVLRKVGKYSELPPTELSKDLAMATMGSALSIPIVISALKGDITGEAPRSAAERDAFYREGKQAYSIRIGDSWVSYRKVEPLATIIGLTADVILNIENADITTAADTAISAFSRNLNDKTFLQGLSNLVDAISSPEKRSNMVANILTGFVPFAGSSRFLAQLSDPTIRQPSGIIQTFEAQTPGLSQLLLPRRDVFGTPAQRTPSQVLSPFGVTKVRNDLVDAALKENGILIGPAGKTINGIKLTADEWDQYQNLSGQIIKATLFEIIRSDTWVNSNPREREVLVNRATSEIRSQVQEALFPLLSVGDEIKKQLRDAGATADEAQSIYEQMIQQSVNQQVK